MTVELSRLRERTVLVTGAGGFLGTAVVRRLGALGARVRAWRTPAEGDITDPAALREHVRHADCVFHLAGLPSVRDSFTAPAEYVQTHAVGTLRLLETCIALGVPRLVFVSSAEVYGPALGPVAEDHARAPRSPYAIAKLAAEQGLELCAREVQVTIVRPFSVYGPGASPASLIETVIAAIRRGETPAIADPRPVRDYVFVDDAADGIVRAGCRATCGVRAYNLASGVGTSARDIVLALLRAAGRSGEEVSVRAADRPVAALTLELVGDPRRARDELGWGARIPLDEGLACALGRCG